MISEIAQPNDFVICLGAGSISKWAGSLPKELEAILPKAKERA
jgi:UDP-N-acetylmuramate--alanine ligase